MLSIEKGSAVLEYLLEAHQSISMSTLGITHPIAIQGISQADRRSSPDVQRAAFWARDTRTEVVGVEVAVRATRQGR